MVSRQLWLFCISIKIFFLLQLNIFQKYLAEESRRAYLPLMMKANLSRTYCSEQQPDSTGSYANLQRQRNRWCKHIHWSMQHTANEELAPFCFKKKSPQKQNLTAQQEVPLHMRIMPKMFYITRLIFFQARYSNLLHISLEQLKMAGRKRLSQDV